MAVNTLVRKMMSIESPGCAIREGSGSAYWAGPKLKIGGGGRRGRTEAEAKELWPENADTERRQNAVGGEPDEGAARGLVIGPRVFINAFDTAGLHANPKRGAGQEVVVSTSPATLVEQL